MHPVVLRGAQVVGAAFGLFGGFIGNISPPSHLASTGMASVLALLVFMWIVGSTHGRAAANALKRMWLIAAGVCFVAAFLLFVVYLPALSALVWKMPLGEEGVGGLWYSPEALKIMQEQGVSDPSEILAIFGGIPALYQVWPFWSHLAAQALLYSLYSLCVLTSLAGLFAVSEGIFGAAPTDDDDPDVSPE